MTGHDNPIITHLIRLGLSTADSFRPYHHRVRDRDDIRVLRCSRTGVIVLDRAVHLDTAHYRDQTGLQYWGGDRRDAALERVRADDERRWEMIRQQVGGRAWLDVGTGLGGILDLGRETAGYVAAVEPQPGPRTLLEKLGYPMFASVVDAPPRQFDIATLFHVFEHVPDPVGFLPAVGRTLRPGGSLCVEVPHARDCLLERYDCDAFRAFTLWSEHVILHTRETLTRMMADAGFVNIRIAGLQRYPLANHLHWLARGRPGGHETWRDLVDPLLDNAYAARLDALDMTDTLVAWAEWPG